MDIYSSCRVTKDNKLKLNSAQNNSLFSVVKSCL